MVSIDTLRALAVATNSLRYNPEIDPDAAAIYEQSLVNLRDELCQECAQEPNPPLTLEDFRKMDGEPVWVTCFDSWRLCYGLSDYRGYLCMETGNGSCILMKDYGEKWLAYRRKPEEGSHEK